MASSRRTTRNPLTRDARPCSIVAMSQDEGRALEAMRKIGFPRDVFLRPSDLRADGLVQVPGTGDPSDDPEGTGDLRWIYRLEGQVYRAIVSKAGTVTPHPGDREFRNLDKKDFDDLWVQFERSPT